MRNFTNVGPSKSWNIELDQVVQVFCASDCNQVMNRIGVRQQIKMTQVSNKFCCIAKQGDHVWSRGFDAHFHCKFLQKCTIFGHRKQIHDLLLDLEHFPSCYLWGLTMNWFGSEKYTYRWDILPWIVRETSFAASRPQLRPTTTHCAQNITSQLSK